MEKKPPWITAPINLSTDRTDVPKPFRHLENEKVACHFSRQKWGGFPYDRPYDQFSMWKSIVHSIRRRERCFFTSESSPFASLIALAETKHNNVFITVILWVNLSTYIIKKKDKPKIGRRWWDGTFTEDSKRVLTDSRKTAINLVDSRKNWEILTVSRE